MKERILVEAWFDGCCEPVNPGGHASFGALIKVNGDVIWSQSGYVGHGVKMSNNVAEYQGAIACLRQMRTLEVMHEANVRAIMRGDSKLVINQLDGRWRVKRGLYVPHYRTAIRLRLRFTNLTLCWIPREQNSEADVLSKQILRDKSVEFRLQSE